MLLPQNENSSPNLEYTRRLHEEVTSWYHNADFKAQVILTLDGVFLTVAANTLFKDAKTIEGLPWYSLSFLGLMSVTLALSLFHAISCIWSRLKRQVKLEDFMNQVGVDRSRYETYVPSVCWFFQFVAFLDETEFEKRMRALDSTFEIDAMSSQIYALANNVTKKHKHVNYSFGFAGITLILFLASGISLIIPV